MFRLFLSAIISITPATLSAQAEQKSDKLRLDHLIIGVADLDESLKQFEALTGIRPVYGGKHPDIGTHNALISLGENKYLEIIAPQPGGKVADFVQFLHDIKGFSPVMWAVTTEDMTRTVDRLATAGYQTLKPAAGLRKRENGLMLNWTVLNMAPSAPKGSPFFIEWGENSTHPASSSPKGCEIQSFKIKTPEPEKLSRFIEVTGLTVPVEQADALGFSVSLNCPYGIIQLGQ